MQSTEIKENKYSIRYNINDRIFTVEGSLLLTRDQYSDILDFLKYHTKGEGMLYLIDMTKLKFLNSSGISMITSYLSTYISNHKDSSVHFKINTDYSWQNKLCINLKRILPKIEVIPAKGE